jgi:hypothetical protein
MSSALTHFRTVMAGFPRLTHAHVPSGGKAKLRTVTSASYNMLIPEWREATQRQYNKPCLWTGVFRFNVAYKSASRIQRL